MRAEIVACAVFVAACGTSFEVSDETAPGNGPPAPAPIGPESHVTVLATLDMPAIAIAVDDENVYWTEGAQLPPMGTTPWPAALACSKSDCGSPTVLGYATDISSSGAADGFMPPFITVDRTNVYWASSHGGASTIVSCAIGGCGASPTTIFAPWGISGLGVGQGTMIWTSPTGVAKCSPEECSATATELAPSPGDRVVIDGDDVYWSSGTRIERCTLAGCTTPTIVTSHADAMFTVDANNVYWHASGGGVMKCAKENCAQPEVLVDGAVSWIGAPVDMVADGRNVYWISEGWVLECAVGGCDDKPTRIDTPYWDGSDRPNRLALDDSSLYWTTGNLFTGTVDGKWSHSGGAVMKRMPK